MRVSSIPTERAASPGDYLLLDDETNGSTKARVRNLVNSGAVDLSVDTTANLAANPSAADGMVVWVRQEAADTPWGDPKPFQWSSSSEAAEGLFCVATSLPTGRWIHVAAPETPLADDTTTFISVYDGAGWAHHRVLVGAADSGGAGYRALRIPN